MSTNPAQGPQNWQQPQQQQPYPTPGQPSAPYPPQQPPQSPKKKHTGCKVAGATLGALALILIVVAVAIPGDDSGSAASPASAAPAEVERGERPDKQPDKQQDESPEEPKPAQMGDNVQAGSFAFVVSGIECGIDRVGDEFLGEEAQGQYCVVDLSITNNGNEAVTFYEGDNTLVDGKGREYATSEDSLYLQNGDWLLTDINPGNTAEGQLLFDIPDEVKPTKIVLAGSGLFDNPVEVALS